MYESRMVNRGSIPGRAERERLLADAGYNVFQIPADAVAVDLLTDSGTGTMSTEQWAALLRGDEAYAGSESFAELEDAVADVMGFDRIVPAHQGRGAEHVLYGAIVDDGDVVLNNTHFDTTRAHIAEVGGEPVDCPVDGAMDPDAAGDFLGNLDVDAARAVAEEYGADRIPAIVVTVTNNAAAGQPVSIENVRRARLLADDLDARLVIDACRFAENAAFVREREPGWTDAAIPEIARELLGHADALVMSGKKDGLANVGGFVAIGDGGGDDGGIGDGIENGSDTDLDDLFDRCKQRAILYEGFPTYGGMAGRDMAAMAVGLREAVEDEYLAHRLGQVRELADLLTDAGVPVYRPVGGHAVYVDAAAVLPDVPPERFPAQALVCAAYLEGGIRTVELGSFAFPDTDRPELVRLALPRRTYHREHLEMVAEAFGAVVERADELCGFEVVEEPARASLRHFSARLEPVDDGLVSSARTAASE